MSRSPTKKPLGESGEANDRREEILAAATCLFAEQGFTDGVTQLLADRLGVGKGTIYRHFPSKQELFLAAADRAMRQLDARMEDSIRDVEDPLERIARGVRTYLDFFAEHEEFVELLIQERAQFKDRARPTYFVHRETRAERWRELYRSLIAEGRVRDIPVGRIADVITAALYGAMFLTYFGGRSETFAASAEDILDVLLHGILSDEERRRRAESTA
jgi:AcrR family transcriptional regulator